MVICEKCKCEKDKGAFYEFHYGHYSSTPISTYPSEKSLVKESIAGSMRSWICQTCMLKGILGPIGRGLASWAVGGLIFLAIELLRDHIDIPECVSTFVAIIIFVGFCMGIYGLIDGLGEIGVSGENRAIEANRSTLTEAGFNNFYNHRKHREFKKRMLKY